VHIQGINVIFYWVTDVDRSTAFYRDVLGLDPGPRHGDWQEFDIDGPTRFAIHGGGQPVDRPTAQLSFAVADLEEALDHMAQHGFEPLAPITN